MYFFLAFVAEGVCDICRPFRLEMLRKISARWWLFGSERVDFSSCKGWQDSFPVLLRVQAFVPGTGF